MGGKKLAEAGHDSRLPRNGDGARRASAQPANLAPCGPTSSGHESGIDRAGEPPSVTNSLSRNRSEPLPVNVQLNSVSDTRKNLVVTLDKSEVDTEHQAVVAEFGQGDLGKGSQGEQVLGELGAARSHHGNGQVGCVGVALSLGEASEDGLDHLLVGEAGEDPRQLIVDAVVLEAADEDIVNSGARNDAELSQGGYRAGQTPAGDGHSHPPLDEWDLRGRFHP